MRRKFLFSLMALGLTAACAAPARPPALGSDGKPLPRLYRIQPESTSDILFRVLDGVNTLRAAGGRNEVALNAALTAAAATHSRDMAVQNRPWHFGSDGSSPILRVQRAGYAGTLIGENISETYETELETLSAWMEEPSTRAVILDRNARDLGFAWYQEENGKIWWTMLVGGNALGSGEELGF